MIYFIYGEQYPTIKKQLKKLKESLVGVDADEFSYVSLSAKNVTVQDIVSEVSKPALFSDHKMVVVTEPYFLTSSRERVEIEKIQNYEVLKKYIENPSQYSDLVFVLEGTNVSARSEIYKLLKKHANILEVPTLTSAQLSNIAMQYFVKNKVEIAQDALDELLFRCNGDLAKFQMEANKLCLYNKTIKLVDVQALVSLKLEQNAFLIAENLIKRNSAKALKIYYDLRVLKEEPVRLIALMASQFRIITQVGILSLNNETKDSIAKVMGIHPYRVQLALQNLSILKLENAMLVLDKLYELDYKIKSGQIDPYYGFELFILNFRSTFKN